MRCAATRALPRHPPCSARLPATACRQRWRQQGSGKRRRRGVRRRRRRAKRLLSGRGRRRSGSGGRPSWPHPRRRRWQRRSASSGQRRRGSGACACVRALRGAPRCGLPRHDAAAAAAQLVARCLCRAAGARPPPRGCSLTCCSCTASAACPPCSEALKAEGEARAKRFQAAVQAAVGKIQAELEAERDALQARCEGGGLLAGLPGRGEAAT